MSRRQAYLIITGLIVAIALVLFFNRPKEASFPFAGVIERFPDYRPPGEGVSLYPTGGPFGVDTIEAIEVGPSSTLFVGTFGGGAFLSHDGGKHWRPSNLGLNEKFISTLFALDKHRIFAGTVRNGLFMSEDNGGHWKHANQGLKNLDVITMTLRSNTDILVGTGRGVFRSRNGGTTWMPFNEGLDRVRVQSIVETKSETLFAATHGQGVFKREKTGTAWESVIPGFSFGGLEERIVRALVLGKDDVLLAGTLSAGIFWSADGGEHWESGNAGLRNRSIRTLAADQSGLLYAGTGEGVYISKNNGKSWSPFLEGMDEAERQIHSFAVDPTGVLYAGGSQEIYRGRDQLAWEPLHDQLMISPILNIVYDEKEGIVVGTNGKGTYINRQDVWVSDNLGLVNLSILSMARGEIYLYALTHNGVYRRQRIRHQWSRIEGTLPGQATAIGVGQDNRLYLGTTTGLYASPDQGATWQQEEALASEAIETLTVSGLGKDITVLATTADALWSKSVAGQWKKRMSKAGQPFQHVLSRPNQDLLAITDDKIWQGGLSGAWQEFTGAIPKGLSIRSIAADPHDSKLLYIGTDRGLFWSLDNGENWQAAELYTGGFYEGKINQVVTTTSSAIWLATEADGVVLAISKPAKRSTLGKFLSQF